MSDPIIGTTRRSGIGDALTGGQAVQGNEPAPLADEYERLRLQGLRALARMIVQHAIAHPEMFEALPVDDRRPPSVFGAAPTHRRPARTGDAA